MSDGGAGPDAVIAEGGKFGLEERTRFDLPFAPGSSEVVTSGGGGSEEEPEAEGEQPEPQPTPPGPDGAAAAGCAPLDVSVTLDQYPTDTRWEVVAEGADAVAAAYGPYLEDQAYATVDVSVCLDPGAYEFRIFDVYGDGMYAKECVFSCDASSF